MGKGDTLFNSVIGAVVTVLLSFIPFSPVVGGAVSGYLQQTDSAGAVRVSALAGVLAALPFVFALVLLASVVPFLPAFGMPGSVAGLFGGILFLVVLLGFLYTVGLSALGGWLGNLLREEI